MASAEDIQVGDHGRVRRGAARAEVNRQFAAYCAQVRENQRRCAERQREWAEREARWKCGERLAYAALGLWFAALTALSVMLIRVL